MIKNISTDKSEKQTVILIGLVSAICLMLYANFLLVPHFIRAKDIFVKLNTARSELNKTASNITDTSVLKNELTAIEEKMRLYEKMLPPDQPISAILENLNTVAKNSNVKITAITPNAVKETAGEKSETYREVSIRIEAKSGYHELGNFIARLESGSLLMKVADIMIRSNKASPKKHDVELIVLTYRMAKVD
jgi:Tfp pilus assembly protein PilO